jgi:rhodanese-related sulfurtransferase
VLAARLASGEAFVLLDVREPVERSFCKIAVDRPVVDLHVPVGRVTEDVEAIRSASPGVPVVVYCHHGVRSRMVADWLLLQGLNDLSNLSGGIDAWSLVVDPQVARY